MNMELAKDCGVRNVRNGSKGNGNVEFATWDYRERFNSYINKDLEFERIESTDKKNYSPN